MGSIVGGGSGGFLSSIGSIVGGIFGGPIGAMIGQMVGGMVQNMLGQAMQNSGVDQDTQGQVNNAYQNAFQEASGGLDSGEASGANGASTAEQINKFADAAQLSDSDRGTLQRLGDELDKLIGDAVQKGAQDAAGGDSKTESKTGGSWLMAIAKALGATAGKSAANLVSLSDKVAAAGDKKVELSDSKDTKSKEAAANEYNQATTEMQGASQEFNLLMTTISTTIKALGEALATVARKQ